MQPRPFEYVAADSVGEAIDLLAEPGGDTRLIAGGQSLVPMMSLGLARPDRIVDIGRLELAGIEIAKDTISLGGLTRHRELERSAEIAQVLPLAPEVARHIGNPRVRNRGTLAGSLAHADPAAELGAMVLAYGGKAAIQGSRGLRHVQFEEFFEGIFTTAVQPDEVLVGIELERPPRGSGHGFFEVANRADDFATAAAAVIVALDSDGRTCADARIALAGVGGTPIRATSAEQMCIGAELDARLLEEVARCVRASVTAAGDAFVSAAYRERMAGVCAVRALESAWARAGDEPS